MILIFMDFPQKKLDFNLKSNKIITEFSYYLQVTTLAISSFVTLLNLYAFHPLQHCG